MVDRRREAGGEAREPRTPGNHDDDRDRDLGKGARHFGEGAELENSRRLDHPRRPPGGGARTDQRILDDLAEAFRESDLDESQVEFDVDGGVVALRGALGTEDKKRRAEDLVLAVPGVRDVVNRITISGGAEESP